MGRQAAAARDLLSRLQDAAGDAVGRLEEVRGRLPQLLGGLSGNEVRFGIKSKAHIQISQQLAERERD